MAFSFTRSKALTGVICVYINLALLFRFFVLREDAADGNLVTVGLTDQGTEISGYSKPHTGKDYTFEDYVKELNEAVQKAQERERQQNQVRENIVMPPPTFNVVPASQQPKSPQDNNADANAPNNIDPATASSMGNLHGHKFVVYSSDDWGRWTDAVPVWPTQDAYNKWLEDGNPLVHRVWGKCGMETVQDLSELSEKMKEINGGRTNLWSAVTTTGDDAKEDVPFRHRVSITPFFIVGGPDYEKMKANGCPDGPNCKYEERFFDTYADINKTENNNDDVNTSDNRNHVRAELLAGYKKLFDEGWWHPEYHGRNHFGKEKWMDYLKNEDITRKCFERNLVCAANYTALRTENLNFEQWEDLLEWHKKGLEVFERFWEYKPKVFNCPHNISHPDQRKVLDSLNFIGTETYLAKADQAQAAYLDRIRFDAMVDWWNTSKQFELVTSQFRGSDLKNQNGESNDDQFAILMWHAQNWIRAVYNQSYSEELRGIFTNSIDYFRKNHPEVVFVTSSELFQIRERGWSIEKWPTNLIIRNYQQGSLKLPVSNSLLGNVLQWHKTSSPSIADKKELIQQQLKGSNNKEDKVVSSDNNNTQEEKAAELFFFDLTNNQLISKVRLGDLLVMQPDTEYYLGYSHP